MRRYDIYEAYDAIELMYNNPVTYDESYLMGLLSAKEIVFNIIKEKVISERANRQGLDHDKV